MMVPDEVSLYCPHCAKHTAVTPAPLSIIGRLPGIPYATHVPVKDSLKQDPYYHYGDACWWLGKCNACKQPMLVKDHGSHVFPTPRPGPVSEHIPHPMLADLQEAKLCFAASAWNAAAVMARRALQCAAVQQGAPKGGKLHKQIEWLDHNQKITPVQRKWADAARWVGNHGAHDTEPDVAAGIPVITKVLEEDAKDTIELVEHLFETLYVKPQLANEQLDKRGKTTP